MIYAFGDYELDTQRYELRCAGAMLKDVHVPGQSRPIRAYTICQTSP